MTAITQDNSGDHSPLKYLPLQKVVHIGGVVVPIIAVVYGKIYAIGLASYFMLMFLFMELLKTKVKVPAALHPLWKDNEYRGFATDPFLYFAFILLLLLLSFYFDDGICYASIVVLTIGDGVSTVVGVHGKRYFRDSTKTIEGTVPATIIGFPFLVRLHLWEVRQGCLQRSRQSGLTMSRFLLQRLFQLSTSCIKSKKSVYKVGIYYDF